MNNDLNSIYETIVKFYDNDNFKQLGIIKIENKESKLIFH